MRLSFLYHASVVVLLWATTFQVAEAFSPIASSSSSSSFSSLSSHHVAPSASRSSRRRNSNNAVYGDTVLLNMVKTDEAAAAVKREASEKLDAVGWSMPTAGDVLTSNDPFVLAIDEGIQRDVGVSLESLLNPAKVVNLERDLYELRSELATLTGAAARQQQQQQVLTTVTADDNNNNDEMNTQGQQPAGAAAAAAAARLGLSLTTAECDGGGGGDAADAVRTKIAKKEADLALERKSVFRGWLKQVFLVQAILSFGISYVMATNPQILFGQFDWFYNSNYNMDISITVLGYWWWWLFVIPSLRSRRPKGAEKKALDLAFIGTPLISLLAPVMTKDTGIIWSANFAVVLACYAFAYLIDNQDDDDVDDSKKQKPAWLQFIYKSLDFGSGRERGARN